MNEPEVRDSFFTPSKFWKRELWIFLAGLVSGAGLILIIGVMYLRSHLIEEYHSDMPFEAAVSALPDKTIELFPNTWTVTRDSCALNELPDGRRMVLYRLCNRQYAHQLLAAPDDRRAAAIVPCPFALFEHSDGTAGLVRFNLSFLGRILGGAPAAVFPDEVAPDQEKLLKELGFVFCKK